MTSATDLTDVNIVVVITVIVTVTVTVAVIVATVVTSAVVTTLVTVDVTAYVVVTVATVITLLLLLLLLLMLLFMLSLLLLLLLMFSGGVKNATSNTEKYFNLCTVPSFSICITNKQTNKHTLTDNLLYCSIFFPPTCFNANASSSGSSCSVPAKLYKRVHAVLVVFCKKLSHSLLESLKL
jgi:hypothetical protein